MAFSAAETYSHCCNPGAVDVLVQTHISVMHVWAGLRGTPDLRLGE